ncbi:MAG: translesion DNA synthesis-associated protein ImuA [Spongiibacteraceae bacterium]
MNPSLQQLLQRSDVWRQRDRHPVSNIARYKSTGSVDLDRALNGGWPRSALTELLIAHGGIGELSLLMPLLTELSRQSQLQVWINPPFIPYAPALVQRGITLNSLLIVRGESQHHLWACEQALRSSGCGAVLYWPARALRYPELRKLQVAAATQHAMGFLFRDFQASNQPSPAVLRLQLNAIDTAAESQLTIRIVKQRGSSSGQIITLPRETYLRPTRPFTHYPSSQRNTTTIATQKRDIAPQRVAMHSLLSIETSSSAATQ